VIVVSNQADVLTFSPGVEHYSFAFGKENVAPGAHDFQTDSLLWLASCTKLLTAVAVMQLVESGEVTLDQDLSDILLEFKPPIPVCTFRSDGKLVVSSTDTALTLRILLTHTSGMVYEDGSPEVQAWRRALPESSIFHESNLRRDGKIERDFVYPLIFPPGAPGRWNYGTSIDWAGQVVERVNKHRLSLGSYLQKHIFEPLGLSSDMTFRPLLDPEKAKRLFARTRTHPDNSLSLDPMHEKRHRNSVDDSGGGGCYGTVRDYICILESLMLDDGKLLKTSSVTELLRPQLPDHPLLQARLQRNDDAKWVTMESANENTESIHWNWSLCGQVALDGVPGKCDEGLNMWSGWANTYWVGS
jgi:CubicO group peptidase (beta-lactamase class C family)